MDCIYRIAKWDEVFENNDSRKLKNLSWVAFPVNFNSKGFLRLVVAFGDSAPTMYGAWAALVCVAAKCHKRGTLAHSSGEPKSLEDIAVETRFPLAAFERLFEWATRKDIAWIEVATPHESTSEESPEPSGESPEHTTRPDTTRPDPELPNTTDTERASVRALDACEKIVLDETAWAALVPRRQRIARVVTGNQNIRGKDLANKDWRLCCVAAALAEHRLGVDWLDEILESITDRTEPPKTTRWGHFRGCLRKSAERLGQDFHKLERSVTLPMRTAQTVSQT